MNFTEWYNANIKYALKEGFYEGIYFDDWKDANIRQSFLEKWLREAWDNGYLRGINECESKYEHIRNMTKLG